MAYSVNLLTECRTLQSNLLLIYLVGPGFNPGIECPPHQGTLVPLWLTLLTESHTFKNMRSRLKQLCCFSREQKAENREQSANEMVEPSILV